MNLRGALQTVLGDLAALASAPGTRVWFLLGSAVVLQTAFWYLATPGPALLGFATGSLAAAGTGIAWTVVVLLAVPSLLYTTMGGSLRRMGLTRGDVAIGGRQALIVSLGAVPVVSLAALSAPGLEAYYPWAGPAVGASLAALLGWALLYFLYYLAFEAFYRGFLLRVLEESFGIRAAIWLSAAAATLIHVGKPLPETLAALPASLLFGVMAVRSRSVLYPAVAHLVIGLTLDVTILARSGNLFQ